MREIKLKFMKVCIKLLKRILTEILSLNTRGATVQDTEVNKLELEIDKKISGREEAKGIDLENLRDIKTYIWTVYGKLTCGEEYDYEQTMNTLKEAHDWLNEIIEKQENIRENRAEYEKESD